MVEKLGCWAAGCRCRLRGRDVGSGTGEPSAAAAAADGAAAAAATGHPVRHPSGPGVSQPDGRQMVPDRLRPPAPADSVETAAEGGVCRVAYAVTRGNRVNLRVCRGNSGVVVRTVVEVSEWRGPR